MKKLIVAMLLMGAVLALAQPAWADYTGDETEWVETGWRSGEYPHNGQMCWDVEIAEIIVTYRYHDDGTRTQIDYIFTGRTMVVQYCREIDNMPFSVDIVYDVEWHYNWSTSYDDSCRCWADVYAVRYEHWRDWYSGDGGYLYSEYVGTAWRDDWYWNYD